MKPSKRSLIKGAAATAAAVAAPAILRPYPASAWTHGKPPVPPGVTALSIAVGNLSFISNVNGSFTANGDGTNGLSAYAFAQSIPYFFNAPYNDIYEINVNAWATTVFSPPGPGGHGSVNTARPLNGLMVSIGQQTAIAYGQTDPTSWAVWWVNNPGTSLTNGAQGYKFRMPVLAGPQFFCIGLCMPQGPISQGKTGGSGDAIPQSFHAANVQIYTTGLGIPAEPPGNRDPFQYPFSSYNGWNIAFDKAATWGALADPDTNQIINAVGNFNTNPYSFGPNFSVANASHPVGQLIASAGYQASLGYGPANQPVFIHVNPATAVVSGGDLELTCFDQTNLRYAYNTAGATGNVGSANQPLLKSGAWEIFDNYAQGINVTEGTYTYGGTIRYQEVVTDGAINHMLQCAGSGPILRPGDTTNSGTPWGTWGEDYWGVFDPAFSQQPGLAFTGHVFWGQRIGIPNGVAMPGGLTAGGQMLWACFQNYGFIPSIYGGSGTTFTFYAEPSLSGNALLNGMHTDMPTLLANCRPLRNQGPPWANGGPASGDLTNCMQPVRPGVQSGLPAIDWSITAQPGAKLPPVFAYPISAAIYNQGSLTVTTTQDAPAGSTIVFPISAATFTALTGVTDSAGNTWAISTASPVLNNQWTVFAYAINTAHDLPIGATITLAFSGPAGVWMGRCVAVQAGVTGGLDQVVSTSGTTATGAVSSTVTTATLAQSYELVFGIVACAWASPNNESMPGASTGLSGIELLGLTGGGTHGSISYSVTAATTAVTMTNSWTAGAATHWTGALLALKAP